MQTLHSMVGAPSDVESVTLGDHGVLAGLKPGAILRHDDINAESGHHYRPRTRPGCKYD